MNAAAPCRPSGAAESMIGAFRDSARHYGEAETLAAAIALFVNCAVEWGYAETCGEVLRANADFLDGYRIE